MAVLLELSCGELVLDLFVEECPLACKNFLKLCKLKYYNGCLLYNVQQNYIMQTGDPTGTGKGGRSAYGLPGDASNDAFSDEIIPSRVIDRVGLVCMANSGKPNTNKSQFFITLGSEPLSHLDGKHTVFGEVGEGFDVLAIINNLFCDDDGRPYQDVRIKHTHILDDPFDDLPHMVIPPTSPQHSRPVEEQISLRIPFEDGLNDGTEGRSEEEIEESIRKKEAHSRAIVLEMTGDIPDADVKPPEEVLFVCKLNPVTTDAELEIIFSRFGAIKQCEIIRDQRTGDSLSYAFIEFETEESCVEAYNKMNNVLIDDRRIKVDFSQSVSKLWNKFLLRPKPIKSNPSAPNRVVENVVAFAGRKPEMNHSQPTAGRRPQRRDEFEYARDRSMTSSKHRTQSTSKRDFRRDTSDRRDRSAPRRHSRSRSRSRERGRGHERAVGRDDKKSKRTEYYM